MVSTPKELPDTITLDTAIQVLEEYGYPTSKSENLQTYLYRLYAFFVSMATKLSFSRKELILCGQMVKPNPIRSILHRSTLHLPRVLNVKIGGSDHEKNGNTAEKFLRIGTTLYKTVYRPLISGDYIEEKIPWSYETLRQDYGKNNLPEIEKYDGFCIIPDHIDGKQVHGKYLNQYEPINHAPTEGDFPYIRSFLTHIFGEQLELGLDYLQILYMKTHTNASHPIIASPTNGIPVRQHSFVS